jgi:uncharacterized protein
MSNPERNVAALEEVFASCAAAAVACSGGVDSMTLAFLAHRKMGPNVSVFHALSAAVPPVATERVHKYASREGWDLRVVDAGEFSDENYLANPANRCFFCKTNLYGVLSTAAEGTQLFSGTNVDDLGDWRPGLKAAENHNVRHPFVEAGLSKGNVRQLAAMHGLNDIAELPSAPCLSSRVETGIRIDPEALRTIDRVETLIRDRLNPETVRCRIRSDGVVIELDDQKLGELTHASRDELIGAIKSSFQLARSSRVVFAAYSRGSAFLRGTLK